jgi:hypothetical protein
MRRCQMALERLKRIDPQPLHPSETVARSSCRLVREYLRRVAEWLYLTGRLPDLDTRDALKLDLAGVLVPELSLPSGVDSALRLLPLSSLGMYVPLVALNYIRWEFVAEVGVVAASGLAEPYEPLIRLFERGGELMSHHGFIHVSHSGSFWPKPLLAYAELNPLSDLTDQTLSQFDEL